MGLSVKVRGQSVATFRFVEVHLMETLAACIPTTPEMEAKLLFGEHVWDCAEHADWFGKRTHELRLPMHHSLRPGERYLAILNCVAAVTDTTERIAGFYEVVLPNFGARLRSYLAVTDRLMDAPTVRIIERVLSDHDRMIRQSSKLIAELPDLDRRDDGFVRELATQDAAIDSIIAAEVPAAGSEARP
jgi:hypothetical protein